MIILLALFLASCSTPADDYNQQLQSYVGVSEETLIETFGTPNAIQQITPNEKIITYNQSYNGPLYNNTQPYATNEVFYPAVENPTFNDLTNAQNNTYYCNTTWTIKNNQVINFSFVGDDCLGEN